jgi:hypothetical protein
MSTQDDLLAEAKAIAHGLSSVQPDELHLIVMDLEMARLEQRVTLLMRTIALLHLSASHDETRPEAKPS